MRHVTGRIVNLDRLLRAASLASGLFALRLTFCRIMLRRFRHVVSSVCLVDDSLLLQFGDQFLLRSRTLQTVASSALQLQIVDMVGACFMPR